MKKPLLIFSISLNIILAIALSLFLMLEMKESEESKRRNKILAKENAEECTFLLSSSAEYFKNGRKSDARAYLISAQYAGAENEAFSEFAGITAFCFFEGNSKDERYAGAIEILTSLITGKELSENQLEFSEELRSEYEYKNFNGRTFPSLSSHIQTPEKKTLKIAKKRLGKSVSLVRCESTLFPIMHIYRGGNTFASVTEDGGKLIELFFHLTPTEEKLTVSEILDYMTSFMKDEGITDLELSESFMAGGFLHAIFIDKNFPSRRVKIISSSESGRVCYFQADEYYSK